MTPCSTVPGTRTGESDNLAEEYQEIPDAEALDSLVSTRDVWLPMFQASHKNRIALIGAYGCGKKWLMSALQRLAFQCMQKSSCNRRCTMQYGFLKGARPYSSRSLHLPRIWSTGGGEGGFSGHPNPLAYAVKWRTATLRLVRCFGKFSCASASRFPFHW